MVEALVEDRKVGPAPAGLQRQLRARVVPAEVGRQRPAGWRGPNASGMNAAKPWKPGQRDASSTTVPSAASGQRTYGKPWKTSWLAPSAYWSFAIRAQPARVSAVGRAESARKRLVGQDPVTAHLGPGRQHPPIVGRAGERLAFGDVDLRRRSREVDPLAVRLRAEPQPESVRPPL